MNAKQLQFINLVEQKFGKNYVITKQEIIELVRNKEVNLTWPSWFTTEEYRVGRGKYRLPSQTVDNSNIVMENIVPMRKPVQENVANLIPEKDPNFVSWGFYSDLKNIVKSKMFYPVFISGTSGCGKTVLVEQVCADLKRECIRVNFSTETDITDLIGSNTLEDGNVYFKEGPVLECLENGYILLLDEIDRCNPNNVLILNGILEGRGYYNPKTKKYTKAKEGFNVIVTANSKGMGDESGKYLSQILDSAFLERFVITVDQPFPPEKVEKKILLNYTDDEEFISNLIKWATVIRKTFENGGIDELISTRRLIHIIETYNIFKNKTKAINLCCSRYDSNTKESFIDLYSKIDSGINLDENGEVIDETDLEKVPDQI